MTNSTWTQRFAAAASAIFVIVVGAMLVIGALRDAQPSPTQVEAATLRDRYAGLPIPPADAPVDALRVVDKGHYKYAARNFHSTATPSAVLDGYAAALEPSGWQFSVDNGTTGGNSLRKFCREGVSLTIEAARAARGTNYYLRLAWTDRPGDSAYCGP